jgi:uncharacterized protein (TIGR02246 family)
MGSPTMQDIAAIRQLVRDCAQAWNRQDGIAWGQPFAEDADLRTTSGSKLRGRAAIVQQVQESQCRGIQMELHIESIRFIHADVACVEAVSQLHQADIPFERVISAIVAVKNDDIWRIVIFSNAGILRKGVS